jgi:hypothetical protein
MGGVGLALSLLLMPPDFSPDRLILDGFEYERIA